MKINAAGIELVKRFESCRLKAYAATPYEQRRGIWTIAYGHTRGVKEGDTCTQEEADAWLMEDLAEFEAGVERLVTVPLTDNQASALISLAYNIGLDEDLDTKAEGLGDSTLLRLVNAGRFTEAAAEFPKWVFQNGQKLNGLVKRRQAERELFERTA